MSTQRPLLCHSPRIKHLSQHPTRTPILHQRPCLILRHTLNPLNKAVLQRVVHTVIVSLLVRIRLGDLLASLASLELGKDKLLGDVAGEVAGGGGGDDGAAVGELGFAGEGVNEHADDGDVVGVDGVE